MSLIPCPECGKQISDKALSCPGCGCPLSEIKPSIDLQYVNESVIKYNGNNVNIMEIANTYGSSKNGAIRYLSRTYGMPMDISEDIIEKYYAYIQQNKNSELYRKIRNQHLKAGAQIESEYREIKRTENIGKNQDSADVAQVVRCPKCKSTSIQYTDKKLSLGRAVVGNVVAGPVGAVLGGLSSKKGYAVCLNCGKKWKL